jgi:hypothetical protein
MNTTLSTQQTRLLALVALLALAGLGYWLVVPRNQSTSSQSPVTTPAHTTPRTATVPTTTPSVTPTKPVTHPAKPVTHPVRLATHGLPVMVARALQKHRVVVVALYSPGSQLDKLARAESQAGAKAQGAGFVALDVFRQKEGNPILQKLGVVDTPAVLVVSRPARVYAELQGVPDRTVVEQAVADARG